ncbi:MAG: ion transporter [Caldimonas sp.]
MASSASSATTPIPGAEHQFGKPPGGWRLRLYRIVFESGTSAGRRFDLVLIGAIVASVAVVVVDSMQTVGARHRLTFEWLEWMFTLLFTVEYAARLLCVERPLRYALSLFGIVDLVAVLPTYLSFFFPDLHALIDVRILRLLRMFRILKMGAYVAEYSALGNALAASRRKIFVFLSFVLIVVLVMGTLMYVIEGPENGFTSIPVGMYWAIVTMTTVGFGDITPKTDLGRFIASFQMLLGWGILAVPTGIVSAEFTAQRFWRSGGMILRCPRCGSTGHEPTAAFCKDCGASMPEQDAPTTTTS